MARKQERCQAEWGPPRTSSLSARRNLRDSSAGLDPERTLEPIGPALRHSSAWNVSTRTVARNTAASIQSFRTMILLRLDQWPPLASTVSCTGADEGAIRETLIQNS
jgi:hypothetical protein